MTRIAITGGSGFVGSHLIKKLKELGADIICLDIKNDIDITDWAKIQTIERFDTLVHLAAKSYVPDSYKYPRDFYHSNLIGTLNALELCRIHKSKMVFISSYVYGVPKYLPIDEKHPTEAFNPYAQTKIIGEQLCSDYCTHFDVPVVILRPFNIYGEGQNENFLIPAIIKQAKTGKILLNDLRPRRDYIYIDDFIDLLVKVIAIDRTGCEIFNAGTGVSYSVNELANMICSLFKSSIVIASRNQERKNEVLETIADITKAKKILNWTPKVDINEGLQRLKQQLEL